MVILIVLCLGVYIFVLFVHYVCFHILVELATVWPPIGENSCSFGLRCVYMVKVPVC